MVGARALHELVEVARRVLLGLLARVVSRGDQRGVGRSAAIFFVLFTLLRGGALILILALGLAIASTSVGALRERCSLDMSDKGPWSRVIRARTPVVWPTAARGVCFTTLNGCSGERVERFVWCVPTPLLGTEATSRCRDAELSAY